MFQKGDMGGGVHGTYAKKSPLSLYWLYFCFQGKYWPNRRWPLAENISHLLPLWCWSSLRQVLPRRNDPGYGYGGGLVRRQDDRKYGPGQLSGHPGHAAAVQVHLQKRSRKVKGLNWEKSLIFVSTLFPSLTTQQEDLHIISWP